MTSATDHDISLTLLREEQIQMKAIHLLSTLIRKGTFPHAFLFTGIEGVGKQSVAMMFAMACNCADVGAQLSVVSDPSTQTTDPCGVCRSCKKIRSGNHPDISLIEPTGVFIRIDQIRSVCHTLGMKPYEAKVRVVIIANAGAMNPEAGNALLKVLEEPPDRTVLILTAIQTTDLLPTIQSRCQHIRFDPILREDLESLLIRRQGLDPDEAMIIAALANGSYSKASLMSRKNWINRRNWLLCELNRLLSVDDSKPFPVARVFAFAEKLSKNKEILQDSLEIIKTWLRDLIICKLVPAGNIINRDLTEKILHVSQKVTVTSLLSKIKAVQSAQKKLRSNANLRLTLEALVMQLATRTKH